MLIKNDESPTKRKLSEFCANTYLINCKPKTKKAQVLCKRKLTQQAKTKFKGCHNWVSSVVGAKSLKGLKALLDYQLYSKVKQDQLPLIHRVKKI